MFSTVLVTRHWSKFRIIYLHIYSSFSLYSSVPFLILPIFFIRHTSCATCHLYHCHFHFSHSTSTFSVSASLHSSHFPVSHLLHSLATSLFLCLPTLSRISHSFFSVYTFSFLWFPLSLAAEYGMIDHPLTSLHCDIQTVFHQLLIHDCIVNHTPSIKTIMFTGNSFISFNHVPQTTCCTHVDHVSSIFNHPRNSITTSHSLIVYIYRLLIHISQYYDYFSHVEGSNAFTQLCPETFFLLRLLWLLCANAHKSVTKN